MTHTAVRATSRSPLGGTLATFLTLVALPAAVRSDEIFLKDGFTLQGTIRKEADLVETAVENVLKAGYRTGDLLVGKTDGTKKVGTQEMGDAIVKELDRLA